MLQFYSIIDTSPGLHNGLANNPLVSRKRTGVLRDVRWSQFVHFGDGLVRREPRPVPGPGYGLFFAAPRRLRVGRLFRDPGRPVAQRAGLGFHSDRHGRHPVRLDGEGRSGRAPPSFTSASGGLRQMRSRGLVIYFNKCGSEGTSFLRVR